VLALLAVTALALLVWVTGDDRRHRLPPATVRATRGQFLVGVAIYAAAFVLSWVWPWLAVAVCGAMAVNHGRHHLGRRPDSDAG
jgi:uncharacterized membrane protein YdbT with pleckstrin-like domain